MNQLRQTLLIAGWEFRRYFKWRDQLLGLLVFILLSGAGYLGGRLAASRERAVTIGVAGADPAALPSSARLRFVAAPEPSRYVEELERGSVRGILTRHPDGRFSLLVDKDPRYRGELQTALDEIVRRERLIAGGLNESDLRHILEPAPLAIAFTDPTRGRTARGEQLVAGIATGLVILGVLMGMVYLLAGITGEKQLRVTESIVSFVKPQVWIDGKILGIGAYSLVNILNMVVGTVIIAIPAQLAWSFTMPEVVARPGILFLVLLFSILGMALWNAFFAAFAATIDDPNTSSRTSFMFVPILFVGLAGWTILRDPDTSLARALAIFPLTSAPGLPIRAILSKVTAVEVLLSVVLLAATIWLTRRVAGRIFEIGMLMYGKEPTLAEIARWSKG